jgi:PIN domain nuclease of toxin-antitoxin system
MNYLLDTHTLIWFINGDRLLSQNARKSIGHKDAINYVSIGSLWEMAIKISSGKIKLHTPLTEIPEQISKNGFQILPITFEDILKLSILPFHHRDPFDRLIIAQSLSNNFKIISKDPFFANYGRVTLW